MLEIEMKFRVADFAAITAKLRQWQARADAPTPPGPPFVRGGESAVERGGESVIEEADHYYNAPDRDFGRTDEAYRLRRIGAANIVTYKGPRQPGLTKTRTEIEVPLAPGAEAAEDYCRLLTHLGYRAVAIVRKKRSAYHFAKDAFALQVCLDEVDQVGTFVEVEIVAPEENKDEAQKVLLQVAAELDLKDAERRSYLEMLLEARHKHLAIDISTSLSGGTL